ncbi:helix-turn-helix transcriptional regulator [Virgisporangium aurantiacum]|uniref:Helix-turn-helix transcriptional regulator n=1 Tax=Virgisporangium aurantiacum TaxID=175570 RepID=A0A8J3ZJQ9_9ACTN|nr:helix-turn-helix transcriptional regulator [Virgisporangium aurantiacum]GIJ64068.1 helix-turn-helix transcriptional regulator [Virgisporangium aurantiacum]
MSGDVEPAPGRVVRGISPLLVGRGAELAALGSAGQGVLDGRPTTVLVSGEAGIGKSRLVSEFAASLGPQWSTVTGGCLELGAQQFAYTPFLQVVRRLVGWADSPVIGPGSVLRSLLPGDHPAPGPVGTGRFRLLRELLALIEKVSWVRPLLLVVEDLHWADPASCELFAYLARNLDHLRVLLIGTIRTGELGPGHPVRQLASELSRLPEVTALPLEPLSVAQVGEQLTAIDGRYDPARATATHRRSGGNPLFVEALAAAESTKTGGHGGDTGYPLRALLLERVARLPKPAQHVLAVASVASGAIRHELLALLAELADEELDGALQELVEREQLVATESGYRYRHEMIREAVYRNLLPGRRRRLHAKAAAVLAEQPGLATQGHPATELAEHWHLAGQPDRAFSAALIAADKAHSRLAHEEELRFLERALDLTHPDDAGGRLALLRRAATVAGPAGAAERGLRHCTNALALLDAGHDPIGVARLLAERARFKNRLDLSGRDDLERALGLLRPDEPSYPLGLVYTELAMDDEVRSRFAAATEHATRALRVAEALDDEGLRCRALAVLGVAEGGAGATDAAVARLAEAQRIASAVGDSATLVGSMQWKAYALLLGGRFEEVIVAAKDALRMAESVGLYRRAGPMLTVNLAGALLALGRWDEALQSAERALSDDPEALGAMVLRGMLAYIHLGRGDIDLAGQLMTGFARLHDAPATMRNYLFWVAVELQCDLAIVRCRPEEADEPVDRFLKHTRDQLGHGEPELRALLAVARVLRARLGAAPRNQAVAARVAAARADLADLVANSRVTTPLLGAYRLALDAELRPGRLADWDRATAAWRDLRHVPELTRCLIRSAEVALANSNRAGAQSRLREAHDLATGLRSAALLGQISALSQRARLEPVTPPANPAGLTNRELDVLRVLARGRSNRQIAAELFISPGTVSVHVSRVFTKLGVSTRSEAIAYVGDQGLL